MSAFEKLPGKDILIITEDEKLNQVREVIDSMMVREKDWNSLALITVFSSLDSVCMEQCFPKWNSAIECKVVLEHAPEHYAGNCGSITEILKKMDGQAWNNTVILSACTDSMDQELKAFCESCGAGAAVQKLV